MAWQIIDKFTQVAASSPQANTDAECMQHPSPHLLFFLTLLLLQKVAKVVCKDLLALLDGRLDISAESKGANAFKEISDGKGSNEEKLEKYASLFGSLDAQLAEVKAQLGMFPPPPPLQSSSCSLILSKFYHS